MASAIPESRGHGTCGLPGLESVYTVTSAAPALELLLSISSSLWVTLLSPGRGCMNLVVRMATWVLENAALRRLLVQARVFMIGWRMPES